MWKDGYGCKSTHNTHGLLFFCLQCQILISYILVSLLCLKSEVWRSRLLLCKVSHSNCDPYFPFLSSLMDDIPSQQDTTLRCVVSVADLTHLKLKTWTFENFVFCSNFVFPQRCHEDFKWLFFFCQIALVILCYVSMPKPTQTSKAQDLISTFKFINLLQKCRELCTTALTSWIIWSWGTAITENATLSQNTCIWTAYQMQRS